MHRWVFSLNGKHFGFLHAKEIFNYNIAMPLFVLLL
jgi:hypothetical protein